MAEDLNIVFASPAEFQTSALKQTPGTSQDFPQLSQPNASYSNEKVDLILPNEQPLPSESADATNLASLLTRSVARSSCRNSSNALWRGSSRLQDNDQSSSAKTPDNNERSTDNEEDTMQRSSFRRSSKPIRQKSINQRGPITGIHLEVEPQGACGYTPPTDTEKMHRWDPPDGTNQVPSEGPQRGPIYQNVGPALRDAENQPAVSRRKESSDEDSVLLELIMTGDEHCVEDWPLGSPELDPNFRPSGSLRLRRESFRFKELEEINLELTKRSSKRRTLRRFKSKTKTTPQQNQDPQGAASSDASPAPTTVSATSSSGDLKTGSGLQTNLQMTRNPLRSSSSSITSVMSNPWVNFGTSSGDNISVNSLVNDDTNHPTPSKPAPVDQTAAANPLPTIYEANNVPPLNPQTGARPRNDTSAAPRSEDVHLGEDIAAVDDATVAAMDADSLMEWWYAVEEWNQVPLETENMSTQEEEISSLSILIDKVHRALNVFYRVYTECAEILWQSVTILHAIANDIKKFHKDAVIANTAMLVGRVLAPLTMGFSAIAIVAGLSVATAADHTAGMALISAASVLVDNENYLLEIQKILTFIRTGLSRLRDHPMLRSRRDIAQDDGDIQKAVQMQRLLIAPVSQALAVTTRAVNTVQGMFSGVKQCSGPGNKGSITIVVKEIKESANVLQSCVFELDKIKNQLEVATEKCGLSF